jgi:hypothetical protein
MDAVAVLSVPVALAAFLAEALLLEEDLGLFLVTRLLALNLLLVKLLQDAPLDLPQWYIILLIQILRAMCQCLTSTRYEYVHSQSRQEGQHSRHG